MESTKKDVIEISQKTAEEIKKRIIDDIYEKYKDECDAIIEGKLSEHKDLVRDTDLFKLVAVFHYLDRDEAKINGRPPLELEQIIKDFNLRGDSLKPDSIKTHIPKNYVMPNHKIVNAIAKYGADGYDEIAVTNVIPKEPEIKTKVTLQFDDNIELPKNYTQYDRAVFGAICSLYEEGTTHFTPSMVYRVMTGKTGDLKVTPQTISAVTRSIEKQLVLRVSIDATEELRKRKIDDSGYYKKRTYILPLEYDDYLINNTKVKGYRLISPPRIYEFCKLTRQIVTVPLKLLNTKSVRSTPEIIVIKEYLVRQIELIKNNYRNNSKMLYETIFTECGINTTHKTTEQRYRTYISKILSEWVDMEYIKSHKEYKKGNKVVGIEIKI